MKEIRVTKMVEVTEVKFVANDGKEFIGDNAERECEKHERLMNEEKLKNEFNRLNPKYIHFPIVDWFRCDAGVLTVHLEKEYDFDVTLCDYYESQSDYMELDYFKESKPEIFPCDLVILKGEYWVSIFGTVEELNKEMLVALKELAG